LLDGLAARLDGGGLRARALADGPGALNSAGIFGNLGLRMGAITVEPVAAIGSKEKAATTPN
jgi:hypothetical protein